MSVVKPKPKYFWLMNHTGNPMMISKLEANTCSRRQARENACEQVTIGFDFTSDWLRNVAGIFSQSQRVVKQNRSNREITFET